MKNPKEDAGAKKCPHHLVPPRVLEKVAFAMKEGADKYGPFNYRKAGVNLSTYYASTRRHIDAWYEGDDIDKDSNLHHLVKAIAGLIVCYDSILQGNHNDDRP